LDTLRRRDAEAGIRPWAPAKAEKIETEMALTERQRTAESLAREIGQMGAWCVSAMPLDDNNKLRVSLNPAGGDFSGCKSMQDIGTKLLQSVGITNPTDEQIAEAIAANDRFIARLEGISMLGQMDVGEPN
jgi:hypothetical protein